MIVVNLILLGAPGAGKGTQAEKISDSYNMPIIGTGDLIRNAVKEETPIGIEAKEYMESGQLVPDEIVINLLKERMQKDDAQDGFILDGFPRNVVQAETLKDMGIKIDRVINIDVPDDKIIARLSGRRVCGKCGSSYHIEYKKPEKDNICDRCGGELIVRKDDEPEVIKNRLEVYHEQTKPLISFYENMGILKTVVGQEEIEDTTRLTLAAVKEA